ncbi:MAG: hypothetical protein IT372_08580 [Polyangiaceae bacterium]|nr:hypothetical protein [Polyangiaceae bacterium]
MSYRVMSFDGGPGALTFLHCLIDLERRSPGLVAATDAFVGSSLGSWVALYLARHAPEVDAGAITGVELLEGCLSFAQLAVRQMVPDEPAKDWAAFLLGQAPLLDYDGVEAVMREPGALGAETTMKDLSPRRRVIIHAGRTVAPWGPRVYDSADAADGPELLISIALRSGSFPVTLPIRDGQVDGAVSTNNPAMVGVSRILGGAGGAAPVALADLRVLTLGSDDGSSDLSNIFMPGGREDARAQAPATPDPASIAPAGSPLKEDLCRRLDAIEALLEDARRKTDHLAKLVVPPSQPLAAPPALFSSAGGAPYEGAGAPAGVLPAVEPLFKPWLLDAVRGTLDTVKRQIEEERRAIEEGVFPARRHAAPPPRDEPWGWMPWMIYPLNILFLLQVMLSSEGRGVADQCRALIQDRSFRLGPVGLLSTNGAFLLLLFGFFDLAYELTALTARQWTVKEPAWLRRFYDYRPGLKDSSEWIARCWMPA